MSMTGDLIIRPGQTIDGKDADGNVYPQILELLGKKVEFEDFAAPTGQTPTLRRAGGKRRYLVLLNDTTISLLPKLAVRFSTSAGKYGKYVDGYGYVLAEQLAGIVDDRLPSTGVPAGHVFLACIEGFHLCKTAVAADATNLINVGNKLVAETSAASTSSTTAGRLGLQVLTALTGAFVANPAMNFAGYALTAKTTANTDNDILVKLNIRN